MENGDETFASPTAGCGGGEFEQPLTNGGGGGGGGGVYPAAKAYDAGELDALREAKRDLEDKLAAVEHENRFLGAEDIATAEHAIAASEGEAALLRDEVKRVKELLAAEKSNHEGRAAQGPRTSTPS
ncbi:hypothetical protein OsJ_19429 [Oryza sativa Japonica Group]|uniref:Uncharacterized protein n=1 Tax=Oryza sativa subsp. japonica TaxID=39947 RepID=B9FHL4_ORYSJ|nr:hypothetical protein OsJ_19429 [Oryza sativa Japonica Group]